MLRRSFFLILMPLLLIIPVLHGADTDDLRVHFIDVGQGDSILIQTPDGMTALIDGGERNGRALTYLTQLGITRIDVLIASHPHADHIGGLVEVMNVLPVGGVWTSGALHTTGIFERFIDTIAERGIPYHEVTSGGVIPLGNLNFEVLFGQSRAANLNNTSLVLRLVYGQHAFLFTGDAEAEVEAQLVATFQPQQLQATVLKVGHHGSYSSSTRSFIDVVQPQIAVYSAGMNNRYGHPHQSSLDTLSAVGATLYGTNVDGSIRIISDGQTLSVTTHVEMVVPSEAVPVAPIAATSAVPAAPLLAPTATLQYDPFGRDRDCGGFDTHAEAQAFFVAAGGPQSDPHRLDGDNDGIACESLP